MKSTKAVFGIFVLVSWALLTALFMVGLQNMDEKKANSSTLGSSNTTQFAAGSNIVLSASEVAKHNSPGDCWTIINGKVYDIAKYVSVHPGGASEILRVCGTDGTALFDTMGGRTKQHSPFAASLLDSFYVGAINQQISQSALTNATAKIITTPIPRGGDDGEGEHEDD